MQCLGVMVHQNCEPVNYFLNTVFSMSGSLHCAALSATPASFLSLVLAHRPLSDILAKFAYDTLQYLERQRCTLQTIHYTIMMLLLSYYQTPCQEI